MNILTIGAHFEDIELGCGGSIAKQLCNIFQEKSKK